MRRTARWGWVIAGCALALLAPRPAAAYLWEVSIQEDRPVTSLQVSDVLLSTATAGQVRLQWNYTALAGSGGAPVFKIERNSGGTWTSLGTTTNRYLLSGADWNTAYQYHQYRVRVEFDESGPDSGLPPPPPCADPNDIYTRQFAG